MHHHSTSAWRQYGKLSPEQVEELLTAIGSIRALTEEESLQLEWSIQEQELNKRRIAGRYIPKRGPRKQLLEDIREEELALADKITAELCQKPRYKEAGQ